MGRASLLCPRRLDGAPAMNPLYLCPARGPPQRINHARNRAFYARFLVLHPVGSRNRPLVAPPSRARISYTEIQNVVLPYPTPPNTSVTFVACVAVSTVAVSTFQQTRRIFVHRRPGWVAPPKIAGELFDQSFGRVALDGVPSVPGNEIYCLLRRLALAAALPVQRRSAARRCAG